MALQVYAYGNGDILASAFNAVAMLAGASSYATAIEVTALAAFIYFITEGVFTHHHHFNWKWLLGWVVALNILFVPKVDILVTDQNYQFVNPGPSPLISNVPLGLGVMAHLASTGGKALTDLMETAFADPAGMSYSQNGLGFSQNVLSSSTQKYFTPGQFKQDVDSYIESCVIFDMLAGMTNPATVAAAPNIWNAIASNSARIVYIGNPAVATPCALAYTYLSGQITTAENNEFSDFVSHLFAIQAPNANNINAALRADISGLVMNSYNGIGATGYASAQDIIFQSMMIHQMNESVVNFASANNGGQSALLNLGIAQSEAQTRNQWLIGGELAKKYLPMFRGMIEGFIYGMFPIAMLLMLTPVGGRFMKLYLMGMIWVQSWSPLYSILNHDIMIYAAKAIPAAGGLTMNTCNSINLGSQDMLAVLGLMGSSIPMVALAIVKGAEMAGSAMLNAASATISSSAATGGSVSTTGNLSYGNASMGNLNFQNRTAFQNNLSHSFTEGDQSSAFSHSRSFTSGDHYNTGSGPMRLNMKEAISSQAEIGATNAAHDLETKRASAASSLSTSFRATDSLMTRASHDQFNGTSVSEGISEEDSERLSRVFAAEQKYAKETGAAVTGDHQLLARTVADISAGVSGSGGFKLPVVGGIEASGRAGFEQSGQTSDSQKQSLQEAQKELEDAVKKEGVDNIIGTMRKISQSHEGKEMDSVDHLTGKDISNRLDSAEQSSHEAAKANSLMHQYQEIKTLADSKSRSFDVDATWAVNQAANELGYGGTKYQEALNNPAVRRQISDRAKEIAAKDFIDQKMEKTNIQNRGGENNVNAVNKGETADPPDGSNGDKHVKETHDKNNLNADSAINSAEQSVNNGNGALYKKIKTKVEQTKEQISAAGENNQGKFADLQKGANNGKIDVSKEYNDPAQSVMVKGAQTADKAGQAVSGVVKKGIDAGLNVLENAAEHMPENTGSGNVD